MYSISGYIVDVQFRVHIAGIGVCVKYDTHVHTITITIPIV